MTFFTKNTSHPKRSLQLGKRTNSVTDEWTGATVEDELTHSELVSHLVSFFSRENTTFLL